MKITALKVDNFKRIKAVHLENLGDLVTISGDNAQGKSSIIDAIWNTLAGSKGAKVVKPIREGAKKATSVLELTNDKGETIVVQREWSGSGTKLTIHAKGERGSWAKPQDVLNDLIGAFSFDPLAFATMKEKPQLEALQALVELPFDLAANEKAHADAYAERTLVNRDLKNSQGALEQIEDRSVPPERVDVSVLYAEIQAAEQVDREIETVRGDYSRTLEGIADLEQRIAAQKSRLNEIINYGGSLKLTQIDVAPLRAQLETASEVNRANDNYGRVQDLIEEIERHTDLSEAFTTQLRCLEEERTDGLAKAKFPIEGLGFTADGVTYHRKPFADASQAEKIIVSFSMAMAMNPEVRVVCIKDANVIDSKNMKIIQDLAEEHDYQVFLELVEKDEVATVVIENGCVKA